MTSIAATDAGSTNTGILDREKHLSKSKNWGFFIYDFTAYIEKDELELLPYSVRKLTVTTNSIKMVTKIILVLNRQAKSSTTSEVLLVKPATVNKWLSCGRVGSTPREEVLQGDLASLGRVQLLEWTHVTIDDCINAATSKTCFTFFMMTSSIWPPWILSPISSCTCI